ncbi:MAG: DUF3782 domain-containing protein [Verrucomicrobia bacterium]|nr:DUF3782 domain-containing protein [Verrucomicrobiota bacterium]
MLDTLQIYQELSETLGQPAAQKIASLLGVMYRDLQQTVTKDDFRELKQTVSDLASAQQRTEVRLDALTERVDALAAAQQRTEQRVEELAAAQQRTEQRVEELAAAQQRTEQRVEELAAAQQRTEQRVEELAAAQQRTEQRVEELAAAQQRTEQRVGELAVAQQRTEQRVEELAVALQQTQEAMKAGFLEVEQRFALVDRRFDAIEQRFALVDRRFDAVEQRFALVDRRFDVIERRLELLDRRFGVLGSRWGDGAEEAFRQGLLEMVRDLGYTVEHYQGQDPDGFINYTPRSFDLDVLVRDGEVVVAEIKSNASGADVAEFHRCVQLYERQTGRRATKRVLVAVTIQAMAITRAQELGIIVATGFETLEPPTVGVEVTRLCRRPVPRSTI